MLTVQARLAVSYTASDGRQSEWSDTFQLFMGSPFAVNVQDFFRPNCLMSQYSITADGPQCFRIDSVTLSPPDEGYRIEGGNKSTEPMVCPQSTHPDIWNRLLSCADRNAR